MTRVLRSVDETYFLLIVSPRLLIPYSSKRISRNLGSNLALKGHQNTA